MMFDPYSVLTAVSVATLVLTLLLWRLPVDGCPECGHCRLVRFEQDRRHRAQAAAYLGIPRCRVCDRYHFPDEDHPSG